MRILLLTREFPLPGQPTRGTFNLEMAKALAATHHVRVICPVGWLDRVASAGATTSARAAVVDGIPVDYPTYYYTPRIMREHYGAFLWKSLRATVREVIVRHRPDVVLSYWSHPDGDAALRLARRLGVPGVVMVGGSDVLVLAREPRRRAAIAHVLQRADRIITVSQHLEEAVAALGVDRRKIDTIVRGVDLQRFTPGSRVDARRRLGLRGDVAMLLWVGRMVPVKGLDVLARACALLKGRIDFQLRIIGDGPLNEQVRGDFAARHLGDVVAFTGRVPHADLADWFRAADATVLPSRSEGVPNVLLESIACGTPFVASGVGGIPEIADPVLDRVVPPDDPAALAGALLALLKRGSAGAAARAFRPSSCSDVAQRIAAVLGSNPPVASGAMSWA